MQPEKIMANQAYHAVEQVFNDTENSELQQVWKDSHLGYDTWAATMQQLLDRLRSLMQRAPAEGSL